MGTHVSFILRGYDPFFEGRKPSFFMGFGVQRQLVKRDDTYLSVPWVNQYQGTTKNGS